MYRANDGGCRAQALSREKRVEMILPREFFWKVGSPHCRGCDAPMTKICTHFIERGLGRDGLMGAMKIATAEMNDPGT